eukprot:410007-Rhodomonas_salina.2
MLLRFCYAGCGTELGYGATRSSRRRGGERRSASSSEPGMLLRDGRYSRSVCWYTICGTEIAYAATRYVRTRASPV